MTDEDIAVKLTDHEHEIGSLKHRMEDLEKSNTVLNRLATAVEVMATKQDSISKNVDKLTSKVESLEAEPGKRWKFVIEKSIYFAVGAVIAYMLGQVGL